MPAGLGIQALQSIVAAGFYGEPRCCGAGTAERARTSIDPDVIKTSLQWRSKRHRRRHEHLIPSDQEPAIDPDDLPANIARTRPAHTNTPTAHDLCPPKP